MAVIGIGADRVVDHNMAARTVFDRVAAFLLDNRLGPDPTNYAFAYDVITNPDGALAKAIIALTDGGVRLTLNDIAKLGGEVSKAPAPAMRAVETGRDDADRDDAGRDETGRASHSAGEGLVAQTQMQVEGFQDLMHAMRANTRDFGRDLAATADAMRATTGVGSIEEVIRITTGMLDRVQNAENQLEVATREAQELRTKLEEARDNARRDPLTGLPNRRAFEEQYSTHVAKGSSLCVAVCDIDHFKRVNDGFGHAVGDRVLKAISSAIATECEGHMVARYGGEEFVVLFADIDLQTAQQRLENARSVVAKKRYRLRETDTALGEVTFSAGLTAARPEEAAADAFVRADRLLYAAKADGRNCLKTG